MAGVVFDATHIYEYTERLCKDYLYFGKEPPSFIANVTHGDIEKEIQMVNEFPKPFAESLALFRKLCKYCLNNADGIIFHSSVVMVDGNAYIFTAPSGTGKSTHTRLWRELLGKRAVMVNDDKPIIRYEEGEFYVYGTPWNGKHNLGCNCRAKVKAICKLYRSKENQICKASKAEMLLTILNQTLRPEQEEDADKLLSLIEKMLCTVDIYTLGCNISKEAAKLSFSTMSGESI